MQRYTRLLVALLVIQLNSGCEPGSASDAAPPCIELFPVTPPSGLTAAEWNIWLSARKQFYPQDGCYSKDYTSDWSTLATGKDQHWQPAGQTSQLGQSCYDPGAGLGNLTVTGPGAGGSTKSFFHLCAQDRDVIWNTDDSTVAETYWWIKDYDYVLIEDVKVRQLGRTSKQSSANVSDFYFAKDTLLIQNCGTVIIRNSYFAGAITGSHIRVEGCENVFIDNVEIEGLEYAGSGKLSNGQGIYVYNCSNIRPADNEPYPLPGAIECIECCDDVKQECEEDTYFHKYRLTCLVPGEAGYVDYVSCGTNAFELDWLVIQNCYIHGYDLDDGVEKGNQDGISLVSPANGIVFNNVVEDWDAAHTTYKADAAFDIDHGRYCDADYSGNYFRIERNMFLNNESVKTPGMSDGTNQLLIANNVFLNTLFLDYHKKHDNYLIHNTFAYASAHLAPEPATEHFYKQIGYWYDGKTVMRNNLIYISPGMTPPRPESQRFWRLYQNLAHYYREVGGTRTGCHDGTCPDTDCPVSPEYSTTGRYGQLTKMVDPDFQLYVGNPSLWAYESRETKEYDPCVDCSTPVECAADATRVEDMQAWTIYMDPWLNSSDQIRDVHSKYRENEACFADPEFQALTPAAFVPTACVGLAGFGDPAALDIDPSAPFEITQGFFGGNRKDAPRLMVGAFQAYLTVPPP